VDPIGNGLGFNSDGILYHIGQQKTSASSIKRQIQDLLLQHSTLTHPQTPGDDKANNEVSGLLALGA
jgi:hypothetical protein